MEKVINLKAIKTNYEERKVARAEKKAEAKTAEKKPGKIAKKLGIAGSYVAVATTAAYTAVQVMKHMEAEQLAETCPEEAPFEEDVAEGGT